MANPQLSGEETSALEALIEEMRPRIRHVFTRHSIPPDDAEDLLQETLLATCLKWDTIAIKDAFILGVLRRKCLEYWRKRRTDPLHAVNTDILPDLAAPPSVGLEHEQMRRDLRVMLRSLPPKYRAMIWLRYGVGLNHDEVADRLGMQRTSVRKLTSRMVGRIQKLQAEPWRPPVPADSTDPVDPAD